jgi:hypothetical protein
MGFILYRLPRGCGSQAENELARNRHIARHGGLKGAPDWFGSRGWESFRIIRAQQWTQEKTMLWTIVALFLILWLLGFGLNIGGSLIHLLLVVAIVVFVINLLNARRGAA